MLSEKLANIYIKQGYYDKAISAYKKLSLKYPEKSDYFAEQIEKLRNIINEQQK
jgi:DNA-binding SARP family transcriptional activator